MSKNTSLRINEHGVGIMVCCDTDMDLEVILGIDSYSGWGEFWCCKVCYNKIEYE